MRITRPTITVVAVITLAVAGCSDDDDGDASDTTVATSTTTAASTTSATAPAVTTATAATPSGAPTTTSLADPTSTPGTTAATECPMVADTDDVEDGFPMRMSSLVGADIRTGAHECFERVVIELEGDGDLPGYRVGYEPDPVSLSPSDETVEIEGDATLVVRMASWMTSMEGAGYDGPTEISPPNVEHVLELRMIENFEGVSAWAIGLDEERPFTVRTLQGPPRIVIDIATT